MERFKIVFGKRRMAVAVNLQKPEILQHRAFSDLRRGYGIRKSNCSATTS